MLLLSGTSERRSRLQSRIRALAEAADFTRLAALLTRHQLFPLLALRLQAIIPEAVPPKFSEELTQAVDEASRRGTLLEALALQLQDDLERDGIPALPLKGPLLARSLYADPGLRPAIDVDILVSAEHLARAVEVARQHGYAPPDDLVSRDGYPWLHYRLRHQGAFPPSRSIGGFTGTRRDSLGTCWIAAWKHRTAVAPNRRTNSHRFSSSSHAMGFSASDCRSTSPPGGIGITATARRPRWTGSPSAIRS